MVLYLPSAFSANISISENVMTGSGYTLHCGHMLRIVIWRQAGVFGNKPWWC
jgi:hypothetical protein